MNSEEYRDEMLPKLQQKLRPGKWYAITSRPDAEQLLLLLKSHISKHRNSFELSEDETRFRLVYIPTFRDLARYPDSGLRTVERTEYVNGRKFTFYDTFAGDKWIETQ